jgi:hypothetical protein
MQARRLSQPRNTCDALSHVMPEAMFGRSLSPNIDEQYALSGWDE